MELSRTLFITNACSEKYKDIRKLFFSSMTKYFGYHRKKLTLEEVFFKTYKTDRILIQISATRPEIIGYAEISNAPYIPALEGDLWLEFLNFHYCCDLPLSATNTLFLNTFVYHKVYNPEMLKQLLCEIFYRDNKIKFIVVMECPDYRRYPEKDIQDYYCLETFAKTYYPKCFSAISCTNTQKLHVIVRDSVLPQMRYRKALPEDNDDIVEIVDYDHPELKKQLGEYYIAEELLSNEKSLLIVTEINHLTAGFVWFKDNVNLVLLLENYNLKEFGNLLKFNPENRFEEKLLNVTTAKKCPLEKLFTTEAVDQLYKHFSQVPSMASVNNLSLCSYHIKSHDGNIIAVDENRFLRELTLKRWEVLHERLKSYDYYVQLCRRQYGFYYNIPEGETNAACDANLNAFVIQLFGLLESYDPRQVFQFLLTAFAAFPDKDYCLISISLTSHITPVLFEMFKYFIRVIPRPGCSIDKHLFITHRSAVYGEMSLYPVRLKDTEDIKFLLKQETTQTFPFFKRERKPRISTIADLISLLSAPSDTYGESTDNQFEQEQVLVVLKNIFEDPFTSYKCFTIRCGDSTRPIDDNTIVGFVIIRPFHLFCYLKKHFHVNEEDEFQNFLKAEIIILKLHSFFHFQADLILRELARQTYYCYFYYFRGIDRNYLSNDLITYMEPLEPRRIKKLWFNYFREYNQESTTLNESSNTNDERNKLLTNMDLLQDTFAGFTTNLRPSSNFGNSRNIVILGFTDICKAFLRLMIFSWHNLSNNTQASLNCLPQVNITVICAPGVMEADHEHAFKCETCSKETEQTCWINFKNSDAFIRDVCDRMDVRTWIRFVSGHVKTINNENHLIKMKSECEICYETLLLMCGTDFGVPERIFKANASPPNYCHINNRFDKILFYHKLQILQNDLPKSHKKKSVIVYGCHIRAFEFVNFLLKHNIEGSEINFVIPFTRNNLHMGLMLNNSAEDCRIEEILKEIIEDLGVKIYEFMNLSAYKLHDDSQNIKEVTFKKHISNEELILECELFVSFYEVFLAEPLLEVFKQTNIDTDQNYIMVDENYQTSVSNIYATGNFIKHKTEPNHQYRFVSPQEAAKKIIDALGLIDTEENVPPTEKKFYKSSYFQAQLSLDYMFVKVTTPKRYLANHLDNEYGFPLVTYNDGEFSRVRLNEHSMVEEIVFITKRKISFDFLKVFCGHHELMLNNLKSRWYLKDIINFIDFFQEPWTELLMHDRFEDLRIINKNLIMKTAQEIVEMDVDRNTKRKLMYKYCQDLGITGQIEFAFLEFIRKYRKDFHTDIALPEDFLLPKNDN